MKLRTALREARAGLCAGLLILASCAGREPMPTPPPAPVSPAKPGKPAEPAVVRLRPPPASRPRPPAGQPKPAPGTILAQDREYVILAAGAEDTPQSLARRFLGNEGRFWVIEDFNEIRTIAPGQVVVVPLVEENPLGISVDGYQTVPILCYHRFGEKRAKMVVTPAAFAEQMEYLARHGYRVIGLQDLAAFLEGRKSVPKRSVILTIDDGYRSAYQVAFPILKSYGFPATIFVYTDFIGANDGLTWPQLSEMAASGLIDLQPHSKTHRDLAVKGPLESLPIYLRRLKDEIQVPQRLLAERLRLPMHTFAYPYGDANDAVVNLVREAGFRLAATVQPGGNGFFAHPHLLRRTMIFGEDDLESFKAKLESKRVAWSP